MVKKIVKLSLLPLIFLLYGCTGSELSAEDEIRLYIEKGVDAAENRSANDLSGLIDEHYSDQKGLGKIQMVKLLRVYFFRHKNIYLFTKIRDITLHSANEASVTLHVAMAGSVISDASLLSSLRAKTYKFELQLIKQEEWLLRRAKWQAVNMSDMQ